MYKCDCECDFECNRKSKCDTCVSVHVIVSVSAKEKRDCVQGFSTHECHQDVCMAFMP